MADSLYIASLEQGSGKLVVTLGIMEMLSRRIKRLGFFRPVVHGESEQDNDIDLIRQRYGIQLEPAEMTGISADQARELLAGGEEQRIYRTIVSRYRQALERCDFLLCEGPNISGLSEAFDYDISVRIARELGTPCLYVSNGKENRQEEIIQNILVAENTFAQHQCDLVAIIVNRVSPSLLTELSAHLGERFAPGYATVALPEVKSLCRPTMEEITSSLKADYVAGPKDHLLRDVAAVKVAAMSINNFLEFISKDDLIITPGDRPDIILATLAAIASKTTPSAAGLILSGNLLPAPSMQKLLQGTDNLALPIYLVAGDTYTAAMQAGEVKGVLRANNEQKIAKALGMFEARVDSEALEQKIVRSPASSMSPLMFEYSLFERARASKQHIVLPEGDDDRILRAAEILRLRDVAELTILGNRAEICNRATQLGLKLPGVRFIDPHHSPLREEFAATLYTMRSHRGMSMEYAHDRITNVSYFGTMMVHEGLADGMVSGAAHTTQHTIQPAFQLIRTAPDVLMVSSVFFMCLDTKVLVYGDCAVNPNPDSEELAEIAISSADTAAMFNLEPVIAMLSYSSGSSGQGSDVDLVRQAVRLAQERRPDLLIDGPIQYDAAIDATVARKKMPESAVAGRATVLIFPDLNTGNNTYKAVQRSSGAVAIGPVLQGLNKPVNDLSRGCLVPDIINTVAITAIQAQASTNQALQP
ncbi:phosphate acetyltransferase [Desulfogranum mediterraneum]|uniref:phosphate acetyltransferase n=1 Tax=Desulfogranum mediterraneum TaxID=160661 RepID=UPI000424BB6A|nr:phosphate acetyltransferase [Desulfogranum mediterraneum]